MSSRSSFKGRFRSSGSSSSGCENEHEEYLAYRIFHFLFRWCSIVGLNQESGFTPCSATYSDFGESLNLQSLSFLMYKMRTIIPHRVIIGIEQVSYNKAPGKVLFGVPEWHNGKESVCHCRRCRRHGFDPWVGKIPWHRKWQPTPVFLPGEFHGQKSLVGYSPQGRKSLT